MAEIIRDLQKTVTQVQTSPGVLDLIDFKHLKNQEIKKAILSWL
jgi:hypothetical protein